MMIAVIFEQQHYGVVFEFVKYGGLDNFLEDYNVSFAIVSSQWLQWYHTGCSRKNTQRLMHRNLHLKAAESHGFTKVFRN